MKKLGCRLSRADEVPHVRPFGLLLATGEYIVILETKMETATWLGIR